MESVALMYVLHFNTNIIPMIGVATGTVAIHLYLQSKL